jgi:hypothetical protein
MGPSAIFWQDSPSELPLHERIAGQLRDPSGTRQWECMAESVFSGPTMASRVEALVQKRDPDAVVLVLGSGPFEATYVLEAIKRRWPRLYDVAQPAAARIKGLAGGGIEGGDGLRGVAFRGARDLAAMALGREPAQTPEDAIESAKQAIDVLAGLESLYALVYFVAVCWPPRYAREISVVGEFDRAVRAHATARRVDYRFRQHEMAMQGFEPRLGADGIHAHPSVHDFDAALVANRLADGLSGVR